jgi:hypothetical protein
MYKLQLGTEHQHTRSSGRELGQETHVHLCHDPSVLRPAPLQHCRPTVNISRKVSGKQPPSCRPDCGWDARPAQLPQLVCGDRQSDVAHKSRSKTRTFSRLSSRRHVLAVPRTTRDQLLGRPESRWWRLPPGRTWRVEVDLKYARTGSSVAQQQQPETRDRGKRAKSSLQHCCKRVNVEHTEERDQLGKCGATRTQVEAA